MQNPKIDNLLLPRSGDIPKQSIALKPPQRPTLFKQAVRSSKAVMIITKPGWTLKISVLKQFKSLVANYTNPAPEKRRFAEAQMGR